VLGSIHVLTLRWDSFSTTKQISSTDDFYYDIGAANTALEEAVVQTNVATT
jgi:hypothetical protein